MLSLKINIISLKFIFFLFIIIFNYSCVHNILETDNQNIEIINTTIELNRFENQLFLQVETNQTENQNLIKRVSIELKYIGNQTYNFNQKFDLYDNATNGDIIPYNGIYTLLTNADTISLPEIEIGIEDIIFEKNIMLSESTADSLDIEVIVSGKAFQLNTLVIDTLDTIIDSSIIQNLNNSYIELMINTDYMFNDNSSTIECDRIYIENPNPNSFNSYFQWANGKLLEPYSNQFIFSTQIPFRSLNDCGGTGKAIFRFILHDLDTGLQTISDDFELIIYGCGDNICELNLENSSTCPIDCQ